MLLEVFKLLKSEPVLNMSSFNFIIVCEWISRTHMAFAIHKRNALLHDMFFLCFFFNFFFLAHLVGGGECF